MSGIESPGMLTHPSRGSYWECVRSFITYPSTGGSFPVSRLMTRRLLSPSTARRMTTTVRVSKKKVPADLRRGPGKRFLSISVFRMGMVS